jgi:hypothetical protein
MNFNKCLFSAINIASEILIGFNFTKFNLRLNCLSKIIDKKNKGKRVNFCLVNN